MSKIKANGIEFYYEVHGEGTPFILIEGLGYASWMWYKQINELKKHFKVIIFDNRGVGETDKPDMEYSIDLFADDTAGVMEALQIRRAHVLGVSMGGFIAQEFALKYPSMVEKLILCSTSFGGPNCIPIPQATLNMMMRGGGNYTTLDEIKVAIGTALNMDTIDKHQDVLDRIMEEKIKNPQPKYSYQRQLMAGASFHAEDRIHKINVPTLILAGSKDRVVPSQNSILLKNKVPNAKLELIENGGHLFFMEEPDKANQLIIDFLLG